MQNSFNDERLTPIIGRDRDIACPIELAAEVFEPGLVKRNTDRDHTRFVLGELDGKITPRVQEVAEILSAVGKASVSTNIMGVKWTKLVLNSMNMSTDTISGIRQWEVIHNPKYWDFLIKLGKETVSVATALGYKPEPFPGVTKADFLSSPEESLKELLFNLMSDVGPEAYSCVQQDAMKGRLMETRHLNGLVVKKGREAGVPTPANEAVVAMIEQIEQGKLKPGIENLDKLASSL